MQMSELFQMFLRVHICGNVQEEVNKYVNIVTLAKLQNVVGMSSYGF